MANPSLFPFDNSYARLPDSFYARISPAPVKNPELIALNLPLAEELGLNLATASSTDLAAIFSGNVLPEGAEPIAQAYAGHQFGHFVPQLGDGRALLLGEVTDTHGIRRDIQLKGSGQTPFSRSGDGRAAVGPVMREYIVSEAMHALGIPTTRSLAMVATGEPVYRETALPGAILTRVAASHLRIGTFEFFAARRMEPELKQLTEYALTRHYPKAARENPAITLLQEVMTAQTRLVARWLGVGFIHGVMNTDNMSISGETIDYGPCAFMDHYDSDKVFSSIDRHGRYAYSNQPVIAHWNVVKLAETLLPLIDEDTERAVELAQEELERFPALFADASKEVMGAKLGFSRQAEGDETLIEDFLALMEQQGADFTRSFRALCDAAENPEANRLVEEMNEPEQVKQWLVRWRARLESEPVSSREIADAMRRANPAYIPRNHQIERAIAAATEHQDFTLMRTLQDVLTEPYQERADYPEYAKAPLPQERVMQTFCGT